jgi:hypothetical protein
MRLLSLVLPFALASAQAPPPADAVLSFHFVRAGMPVPEYTITLHQSGSGSYRALYSPPADAGSRYGSNASVAPASAPIDVSRDIAISPQTTARLFEHLHNTARLVGGCESHQKNIANTGAKTISYTGPDGTGECTYNYTENKDVAAIADTFQGIAVTLDEGRSIDLKHRYDRLGLDRELSLLQDAIKDGRALEIATIAPVLQSLLDDTQVMDRVRKRAAGLLAAAK